jgi:hypothetical protein
VHPQKDMSLNETLSAEEPAQDQNTYYMCWE